MESASPQKRGKLLLQGWDIPVDHELPGEDLESCHHRTSWSGHALSPEWNGLPLKSLREFKMMRLMDQITDKKDWDSKVFNDNIIAKWKTERWDHIRKVFDDKFTAKWETENLNLAENDFTDAMFDWCIAELRWKSRAYKSTRAVAVYDADVVKSDVAIPESIRQSLIEAVKKFEEVPDCSKDWHPWSDNKVLDLVHPSLFPLVYGRTLFVPDERLDLDNCMKKYESGVVLPKKNETEQLGFGYSRKFQWLPCDVDIKSTTRIVSYINNAHPRKHRDLYPVIEEIIDRSIPLWNMSLSTLKARIRDTRLQHIGGELYYKPVEEGKEEKEENEEEEEDEVDEEDEEDEVDEERKGRLVRQPEPGDISAWCSDNSFWPTKVDLKRDFAERGLQVIVKLANIELTPESPNYEGGSWHIEGQLNEHICASAIYYYSMDNITPSRLAFRQKTFQEDAMRLPYEQDDHEFFPAIYGHENGDPAVQDIGSITAMEGRLVTFPNIVQHCVQPFSLADPTRPGHRKILALFLVNPHLRIISTSNVPCQQASWWAEDFRTDDNRLGQLSREVFDIIIDKVDFPIGLEEAKELRLELMEERKHWAFEQTESYMDEEFSLCEH